MYFLYRKAKVIFRLLRVWRRIFCLMMKNLQIIVVMVVICCLVTCRGIAFAHLACPAVAAGALSLFP
jgi:hypothetical protein